MVLSILTSGASRFGWYNQSDNHPSDRPYDSPAGSRGTVQSIYPTDSSVVDATPPISLNGVTSVSSCGSFGPVCLTMTETISISTNEIRAMAKNTIIVGMSEDEIAMGIQSTQKSRPTERSRINPLGLALGTNQFTLVSQIQWLTDRLSTFLHLPRASSGILAVLGEASCRGASSSAV